MTDNDSASVGSEELARRLGQLAQNAMEIAMGNFEDKIEIPEEEDAFTELSTALELMRQDLRSQVDALRDQIDRETTISALAATVRELSTPSMEIWDEILLLPLIGTIDTRRARQIVEGLLQSIVDKQVSVVIMDVTGVSFVDTQVANHLLKTVEAARLLGAEVVLTGLNPDSAQTITKLGVDLSAINTKSSMRAGLLYAFEKTNARVVAVR